VHAVKDVTLLLCPPQMTRGQASDRQKPSR